MLMPKDDEDDLLLILKRSKEPYYAQQIAKNVELYRERFLAGLDLFTGNPLECPEDQRDSLLARLWAKNK